MKHRESKRNSGGNVHFLLGGPRGNTGRIGIFNCE
jgi:hypothetical protein